MLNRLLENWLDSASEKGYQTAFCQLLSAKGHTILHSTRHNVLEYGKDVISIDKCGDLCAFQLKGNPGTRLTLRQFREIQNQLVQLVTQPPIYPAEKIRRYKAYLVTNGVVDEEVQRALDDLNRGFEETNAIGGSVGLISRGKLLSWATELGADLWPSGLHDMNAFLEVLVSDGKEQFPKDLLHKLLKSSLGLDVSSTKAVSAQKLKESVGSSALLTAVSLKNFENEDNYFAIIEAWTMYCSYVIAACIKHDKSIERNASRPLDIAKRTVFYNLYKLCEELRYRDHLSEGDAMTDMFVYKGRYTLLVALMSLYWFWSEENGYIDPDHKEFLDRFIPRKMDRVLLWGEGAVPQILIHIFYLHNTQPMSNSENYLGQLLKTLVESNTNRNLPGICSPYYSYEDSMRHLLHGKLLPGEADPFDGETFQFSSYYAEPLMFLLVRANMKQTCKLTWPDYTRLGLKRFYPETSWMFCLMKSEKGSEISVQPELTQDWSKLVKKAQLVAPTNLPRPLLEDKLLLIIFLIVFPYRGITETVNWAGQKYCNFWYSAKLDDES